MSAPIHKPGRGPLLGVYLTRSDLGGDVGNVTELSNKLAQLPQEQVIRWITTIGMNFGPTSRYDRGQQCALALQFLPERFIDKLKVRWQKATRTDEVVFHRQQLWFVLQLALLCSSASNETESTPASKFGECLLIANEVLGSELNKKQSLFESAEGVPWFFAAFLPMFELNWHSIGHADLARAHSIWGNLDSAALKEPCQRILGEQSVNAAFSDCYGIALNEFITLAVAIHFLFQEQLRNNTPLRISKTALLQLLPDKVLECALTLISRSPDQLATDIILSPRQSWAVDFGPLRKYPLVRISEDFVVCPDLQLLESFFEEQLYWLIANAFPNNKNEFRQLYGELFEEHINRVLGEFLYAGSNLAQIFITRPKFAGCKSEVCDSIIDWPETLVLNEYKATRFTRYQKYSGDPDALMRAIDDAFAIDGRRGRKGVGQLAESIHRMFAGDSAVIPGDRTDFTIRLGERRLLPMLVVAEPAITVEFVRQHLDHRLRSFLDDRGVNQEQLLPLVIVSQYQLECLEGYSEKGSVEYILRSYAHHLENKMAGLLDSFGDFVSHQYGLTIPSSATYMQRMRREQLGQTHSRFVGQQ